MLQRTPLMTFTVGHYLAERLTQIGLKHHFAVAGDYNLTLLDQLIEHGGTEQVYSCNELNCSFSAEGYARENGAAAAVVTFSVGAISAMNGLGSAYAENLPIIVISGGPNTNDIGSGRVIHHTIGTTTYHYQVEMVRHVTCAAEQIMSAENAPAQIDHVIRTALRERKPAYLEIACNIADAPCMRPGPISSPILPTQCDDTSLHQAIATSVNFLAQREKVVLLLGNQLRATQAVSDCIQLAEALGCAVTVMGSAKSLFPETHRQFRGVYFGDISTGDAQQLVESADAVIVLGPIWNDYASVGWRSVVRGPHVIEANMQCVTADGHTFDGFSLQKFIQGLITKVPRKPATLANTYQPPQLAAADPKVPLTNDEMTRQINELVDGNTTLFAETGDSWFNAIRMNLPEGARVEMEAQWGHIGWGVPAVHGNNLANRKRRNILMVGDGSFQLTAQEVAQMVRYQVPVIIFLVNNYGYVIEIKIHDGPYNYIQNWDYAGLMKVFNGSDSQGDFHGLGLIATTGAELAAAIHKAKENTRGPTLIECRLDREDCSDMLVQWGKRVASANARKS